MAPPVDTSRKRRASASPGGSPRSARSLLSQGVSTLKKTVKKGVARAVSVLQSRSRSFSPQRGASRQSNASGDDVPSLRSATSDGASSFHFDPVTFNQDDDEDDVQDLPESSLRRSTVQSIVNEPIDIPTDDSAPVAVGICVFPYTC
ncbi:hypothetical protein BDZ89DRAFT_1053135 [Hymenopellis radicata]|nr:hypothetical protein BDZ89DRAFT_1053135 [Hymenopellis radicata]